MGLHNQIGAAGAKELVVGHHDLLGVATRRRKYANRVLVAQVAIRSREAPYYLLRYIALQHC